jgi:hypothetical protein
MLILLHKGVPKVKIKTFLIEEFFIGHGVNDTGDGS